jgi:hypothetical protein
MPFRYLRDELFLCCLGLYFGNRLLLRPNLSWPFLHAHLNDLLCLPFWLPILLFLTRRVGLRKHDAPPSGMELLVPLLVWGWTFEVLLPRLSNRFTADPLDIFYYAAGGLVAQSFWQWRYREVRIPTRTEESSPRS